MGQFETTIDVEAGGASLAALDLLLRKWGLRLACVLGLALLAAAAGVAAAVRTRTQGDAPLTEPLVVLTGILGVTFVATAAYSARSFHRSWSREFITPLHRLLTTIALIDSRELERLPEEKRTSFTAESQRRLLEVARDVLEHQRFVDQVVDNMFEVMFLLNPDGVILKANKAACDICGYSQEELLGQHLRKIFPRGESLVDHFIELEVQFATAGEVRDLDVHIQTADGELLPFSINGVKVETPSGGLLGYTIIAKNMVEIFRLVAALNKSNFDLNKANSELERSYDSIKKEVEVKESERRLLEHELATSQLVQNTFLPQVAAPHPQVVAAGRSVPATYCGGDWWNTVALKDRYYIFIGDVTGHGTPSAMVTAAVSGYYVSVRNTLLAGQDLDVDVILDGFDAVLKAMASQDVIYNMTCFAGIVDFRRGIFRFANAGHTFPQLVRGHRVEPLVASGDRLGTRGSQPSEIVEVPVQEGDLLFFFTDGLVENKNAQDEQFGKRRLKKYLESRCESPVEELVEKLMDEASQFVGSGRALDDDVTIMAMRLRPAEAVQQKEST